MSLTVSAVQSILCWNDFAGRLWPLNDSEVSQQWTCIAHRHEHVSNALPLPISRRWSPQASPSARHSDSDHLQIKITLRLKKSSNYTYFCVRRMMEWQTNWPDRITPPWRRYIVLAISLRLWWPSRWTQTLKQSAGFTASVRHDSRPVQETAEDSLV